MTVRFVGSFLRDVKKLRNRALANQIERAISDVEQARGLGDVASLKRLSGHPSYYRIRIGDYRIGVKIDQDAVTFIRCLHRREIYRFFP